MEGKQVYKKRQERKNALQFLRYNINRWGSDVIERGSEIIIENENLAEDQIGFFKTRG